MDTGRRRFTQAEETDIGELVPEQPSAHHATGKRAPLEAVDERGPAALLAAVELLGVRSEGTEPFTLSPSNDPIAFLLDAVTDAVSLWRGTSVLYRNRAAEHLDSSDRSLERRELRFRLDDAEYVLEIVSKRS